MRTIRNKANTTRAKSSVPHRAPRLARSLRPATALLLSVLGVAGLEGVSTAQTVSVPGTANIYGAGHSAPRQSCSNPGPGPGSLPIRIILPPGAACIEFIDTSGTVSFCGGGCQSPGPDGGPSAEFTLEAVDGISGTTSTRARALHGVFLTDAEPINPPPPILSFTDFSFTQLSPSIAQQFFIGDGLTGTGTGSVQRFIVPSGATRLYIGFADGLVPCVGWYSDNSGAVTATVVVNGVVDQPMSQIVCPTGAAAFTVTTGGGAGPISYRWQIDSSTPPGAWTDLVDGPLFRDGRHIATVQGSQSPTLRYTMFINDGVPIRNRARVTNACGGVNSDVATLSVCLGDFNCDNGIDGDDVIAFFLVWDAGEIAADVNHDEGVDGDDVIAFFGAWDAGC